MAAIREWRSCEQIESVIEDALRDIGCEHAPVVRAQHDIGNLCEEIRVAHASEVHWFYMEPEAPLPWIRKLVLMKLGHG